MRSLLGLFVAAFAGLTAAATVKNCDPNSLFTVNAVGLTPTSPAPGDPVTLHLDYTVPEGMTVDDGTTTYAVTLNFIPFAPSTNPLCQDIPCPLGAGTYKNDTVSTWPTGVSGTFTSKMTWSNPAGQTLLCIQTSGALRANDTNALSLVPYMDVYVPDREPEPPVAIAPDTAPKHTRNLRG